MIEFQADIAQRGAADRDTFLLGVDAALRASERQHASFAVLKLDVGADEAARSHAIGAIRANVRHNDLVAVLSEHEFALLLAVGNAGGAQRVAGKIIDSLVAACSGAVAQDFAVGIAVYPVHGNSRDQLLRAADGAQYQARRNRRGIVVAALAEEPISNASNTEPRPDLGERINSAVEQNEFVLCYQPVAALDDGRLLGAEALVRWHHPELGLLPPAEFLYLADRDGAIDMLSLKFIEYALLQMRAWRDVGVNRPVSVNMPVSTLALADLETSIVARLHALSLPPSCLTLELRDDQLTRLSAEAMKNVFMLANSGVRFAIDDFGRGAASLLALRDLPVHEIKIDPCFITGVASNPADASIVSALTAMCRGMGRRVIAKGIETQAVRDKLLELGCEGGQGFLFSQALDADALGAWHMPR